MTSNIKAHFLVLLATFLIALSFIVSGKLSGIIDPISLTLFRFVLAFIVLSPFILSVKKFRLKIIPSFIKGLKISLFYSLYFIILFKALETTSALNTATLFTLVPLVTAIIAGVVFKDKLTFIKVVVYIIGMIGTTIVIFDGNLDSFLQLSLKFGDILFLLGILSMALYSISTKHFYEEGDITIVLTYMTLFGGILWMGAFLLLLDIPLQWNKIEGVYFSYMLYLSIGATLATVFLYQKATIVIGPNKVMSYIYINPVIVLFIDLLRGIELSNIYVVLGALISSIATFFLLKK